MRVSDGFESKDLETYILIRKARVSLFPSPLISNNFFFTSPSSGVEIFASPLAPGVVLTEDTLETFGASTRTLERLQASATGDLRAALEAEEARALVPNSKAEKARLPVPNPEMEEPRVPPLNLDVGDREHRLWR